MKFTRFEYKGNIYIGIIKNEYIYPINDFNLSKTFIDLNDFIKNHLQEDLVKLDTIIIDARYPLSKVKILSPFEKTVHDIICVGLNYLKHAEESKKINIQNMSESTVYFSKRAEIISGPGDNIQNQQSIDSKMDYETELAVIIGKKGKNITKESAYNHIFGYTILNDFSARDLQKKHGQWYRGKSLDGYTSLGPYIVTKDEFDYPVNLKLITKVNEEIRQNSNTKHMIKDISTLISELSRGFTLVSGDIIATGTPEGVGGAFTPPKFLKVGDKVISQIQGLGQLENKII